MNILNKIIKLTGDIYIYRKPLFVMYKPEFHKLKGYEIRQILNNLKYGDILLRRFDGYLNTLLTPGFWGHASCYIGENKIIHAVAAGVVLEDILDFCRADSVCVLRNKNFDEVDFTERLNLMKGAKHIDYDYEFERYDDQYYCTEVPNTLHKNIFDNLYQTMFGREVLIPDAIYNDSVNLDLIIQFKH